MQLEIFIAHSYVQSQCEKGENWNLRESKRERERKRKKKEKNLSCALSCPLFM